MKKPIRSTCYICKMKIAKGQMKRHLYSHDEKKMGRKNMTKKIGILLAMLLLAGSVLAFQAPQPAIAEKYEKNNSITTTNQNVVVGPWQSLWQMHYKWNPVTKAWEKRVFVPTPSRGTYDFKTKKWVKQ